MASLIKLIDLVRRYDIKKTHTIYSVFLFFILIIQVLYIYLLSQHVFVNNFIIPLISRLPIFVASILLSSLITVSHNTLKEKIITQVAIIFITVIYFIILLKIIVISNIDIAKELITIGFYPVFDFIEILYLATMICIPLCVLSFYSIVVSFIVIKIYDYIFQYHKNNKIQ